MADQDRTFQYGGGLAVALIIGLGLGFAVDPLVGVIAGIAAAFGWIVVASISRRGRGASQRPT